jgi:chromosome segregation ATPase
VTVAVPSTPSVSLALVEDRAGRDKEMAALRADKSKLSEELATAWKETDAAKAAAAGAERRVRQAETIAGQGTKDLAAVKAERDALAGRLATANNDMQNLHRRLAELEKEGEKPVPASVDVSALNTQLDAARHDLATARTERDQLQQQLSAVKSTLASAEVRQQDAATLAAQLAAERKHYAVAIAAQTESGNLSAQLAQADQARQATESRAAGLEETLAGLRRQNAELAGAGMKLENLEKEGAVTARRLRDSEAALNQARRELENARKAQAAGEILAKEQGQLTATVASLQGELTTAQNERDQLRADLAAATEASKNARIASDEAAKQELAKARAERDGLVAQVKQLTDEKAKLAQQVSAGGDAANRLAETAGQLEAAKQEAAALRDQLAASTSTTKTDATRLQGEVDTLGRRLEDARRQLAAAEATQGETARKLDEAQAGTARLERENADLRAEHASLTAKLAPAAASTAATAAATTVSTGAGVAEDVTQLKADLRRAEEKVDMTVRAFAQAQAENERLKTQIAQAAGERAGAMDAGAALARTEQELTALRGVAGRSANETASLRDLLRQTQNSSASLVAENARLRTALSAAGASVPPASVTAPTRPALAATAPGPATPPPAAPPPAPRIHRVVSGDTLTRISSRYYGTWARWQDIYNANRDKLRDADVLPLGAELKIP